MTSSYLYLNGLRVHYLHWNLKADGQPVVLLHGLGSNARVWERVAPGLAQAGLAAVAPDGRGHGLTDKPDGVYDFKTFNRDLAALIEALDLENPLLAGHGWGASLALDYAARTSFGPHAPSGLVLVDGGMTQREAASGLAWEPPPERMALPFMAGMPLTKYLAALAKGQSGWRPDEEAISILLSSFEISEEDSQEENKETITPHLSSEHHTQLLNSLREFHTFEQYARLRCPMLMIAAIPSQPLSQEDREFLEAKERGIARARESIARLQVERMANTSHDIPLQRPAELAGLIADFSKQFSA